MKNGREKDLQCKDIFYFSLRNLFNSKRGTQKHHQQLSIFNIKYNRNIL